MQRTGARQTSSNTQREKSASSPSPARQPRAKAKASEPQAPMTILTRHGSSRDKSGSPANETSKQAFQPQLLKRHEASDSNSAAANGPSDAHDGAANSDGNGKRDQLLSLFSKAPAAAQAPPQDLPAATISPPPATVVSPIAQVPAPAPATVLNFDISQIQNILEAAKGSGPSANAVNKALATSNVTSDGLSNLLSSLSSLNKSNGLQVDSGSSSSDGNERRRYWQDTYEVNGASSSSKQESYPGEYRPDYRYRNTSTYRPAEERYATSTSRPSTYHHGGGYDERRDHGKGSHKRRTIPCKFFAQGLCHFGDACHFLH